MNLNLSKLADNPSPRIPVMVLLDNSSSMNKENRIGKLNNELMNLVDIFRQDELIAYSVELGIVAFEFDNKSGNTLARKVVDFESILEQNIPQLRAFGKTPLGASVDLALDMIAKRKELYKQVGIQYYQPIMIILTDGDPTDCIANACKETKRLIRENKLTLYPIGIGNEFTLEKLQEFVYKPLAKRIGINDLPRLFQWIGESVNKITTSNFTIDTSEIEIDWDRL